MYKREVFLLGVLLCHPLCVFSSCDRLYFQRHGSLDGLFFNESFVSESALEERILCGELCYRQPLCNTMLYNPTSKRCRLYKSFVNTGGAEDAGWQYYAGHFHLQKPSVFATVVLRRAVNERPLASANDNALKNSVTLISPPTTQEVDCAHFRLENALSLSVVNQTVAVDCRSGFTYSPSSRFSSRCSHGTSVLNVGKCALTLLWTDPASPFVTVLPEPLYSGAEMTVRGSDNGEGYTDLVLRQSDQDGSVPFILSIRWQYRFAFFNTKSDVWGKEQYAPNFTVTPNVVFEILVKISKSHFLIFINGTDFLTAPVAVPVEEATTLEVRLSLIEYVEVKYM